MHGVRFPSQYCITDCRDDIKEGQKRVITVGLSGSGAVSDRALDDKVLLMSYVHMDTQIPQL